MQLEKADGNEILLFWFTSLIICMVLTRLVYQVTMLESGEGDDDGCSTTMEKIELQLLCHCTRWVFHVCIIIY
jgi:hypothetical protein